MANKDIEISKCDSDEEESVYASADFKEADDGDENPDELLKEYDQYVDDLRELDNFCLYAKDVLPIIRFFEKIGDYKRAKYYLRAAKLEYAKRVNSYADCLQALEYLSGINGNEETRQLEETCKKKLIGFRTRDLQNKGCAPLFYDEASIYCLNEIIKSLVSASKDAKKYGELDDAIIKTCKEQAVSYIEKNFADVVDGEKAKDQLIKTRNALLCLSASVVPSFNAFVKHLDAKIGQMTEAERRAAHKKKVIKCTVIIAAVSMVLIVAIIIASAIIRKNNGYKAEHFTISVVSKTNDKFNESLADGYRDSGYFYTFSFVVDNASPYAIVSLEGNMDIINLSGEVLSTAAVTLNGKLESGATGDWNIQLNVKKGDNAREIWNTDFERLEIAFKITGITFEDGTIKTYSDTKNKIVHPIVL